MYLEQPATVKSQNVKRQSQEYKQVQLSQTDRTSTFVVDRVKILPCIKFDHKQNLFAVFLTMCTHVGGPNASDLVKKLVYTILPPRDWAWLTLETPTPPPVLSCQIWSS